MEKQLCRVDDLGKYGPSSAEHAVPTTSTLGAVPEAGMCVEGIPDAPIVLDDHRMNRPPSGTPFLGQFDGPEAAPAPRRGRGGHHVTDEMMASAEAAAHVPEDGFAVRDGRGRARHMDINRRGLDEIGGLLADPGAAAHLEEVLTMFENDPHHPIRREDIDIPMILAMSMREGGARLAFSESNRRVVTAGRDAYSTGVSGLDNSGNRNHMSRYPEEMRSRVRRVRDHDSEIPGEFVARRGSVENNTSDPAELAERDMLAAFIVDTQIREEMFERNFARTFADVSPRDREALLAGMDTETRRAWTQAFFGSRGGDLMHGVHDDITAALRTGRPMSDIARDPNAGMGRIITDDTLDPNNLSRERTRTTAAEAHIVEDMMSDELRASLGRPRGASR